MNFSNKKLSIKEAKEIDMVYFLSKIGFEPANFGNNDYWYLSPFRDEKTPSFKVNRKLNFWYDHGIGKGGNIIDFGIEYYHCPIGEFLQNLSNDFSFQPPVPRKVVSPTDHEPQIKILDDCVLSSFALLKYLKLRCIPVDIANRYCREIRYELKDKIYYTIGFKNDRGGFEIRNNYFKGSSSPKSITTINNHAKEVAVFEGFMDFLSFQTIFRKEPENRFDFFILNSLSFFEPSRSFLENHKLIRLYLDRDKAGQNFSRKALSLSNKYTDESGLYEGYKDLNDWLINFGKSQKKRFI